MGTVENVRVEPMGVTWGEDVMQVETIVCVADVADSLDGKYFFAHDASGNRHHFWFNTSGGAATDPAPGGSTAQVVAISTGATAAQVATALEAVIEAVTGFDSTVANATITVTRSAAGYCPLSYDGGAPTGFSFAMSTEGDTAQDLGFLDESIEIEATEDLVDIMAHETGSNVLSQIRTGKQVQITVNIQETSTAQLKRILRQAGSSITPAGANATEVVGYGAAKDFTQTITQAKKLTMHPKTLGASDKSRDLTFHKAYPILESISYSGEEKLVVPVSFKVYPKKTLNDAVEYFCFGDGSQTLT